MTRPTKRGGPRPGAGRKPYADPTTPTEAAVALARIVGPGVSSTDDHVRLDLDAAVAILHKLRRRTKATTSRRKPTPPE